MSYLFNVISPILLVKLDTFGCTWHYCESLPFQVRTPTSTTSRDLRHVNAAACWHSLPNQHVFEAQQFDKTFFNYSKLLSAETCRFKKNLFSSSFLKRVFLFSGLPLEVTFGIGMGWAIITVVWVLIQRCWFWFASKDVFTAAHGKKRCYSNLHFVLFVE